jgi:hypothetical protein
MAGDFCQRRQPTGSDTRSIPLVVELERSAPVRQMLVPYKGRRPGDSVGRLLHDLPRRRGA